MLRLDPEAAFCALLESSLRLLFSTISFSFVVASFFWGFFFYPSLVYIRNPANWDLSEPAPRERTRLSLHLIYAFVLCLFLERNRTSLAVLLILSIRPLSVALFSEDHIFPCRTRFFSFSFLSFAGWLVSFLTAGGLVSSITRSPYFVFPTKTLVVEPRPLFQNRANPQSSRYKRPV